MKPRTRLEKLVAGLSEKLPAITKAQEEWAKEQHIREVTADVSITASTFFQKQGFVIEREQLWKARKLLLKNYRMSKCL